MKIILFGATGMVGQGVLRECLRDPNVESVLTLGRTNAYRLAGNAWIMESEHGLRVDGAWGTVTGSVCLLGDGRVVAFDYLGGIAVRGGYSSKFPWVQEEQLLTPSAKNRKVLVPLGCARENPVIPRVSVVDFRRRRGNLPGWRGRRPPVLGL